MGNYSEAWEAAPFGHFFVNSVIVSVVPWSATWSLCSLAGYAFARIRFLGRGRAVHRADGHADGAVPGHDDSGVPHREVVRRHVWTQLGIDHIGALMLPNLATAFGIFFLRQFFLTVPVELEEAARIDGTSRLGVLFKIVLPLSLPALSTLAVTHDADSWNAFLWPLIVITSQPTHDASAGPDHLPGRPQRAVEPADGRQRDEPAADARWCSSWRSDTSSARSPAPA